MPKWLRKLRDVAEGTLAMVGLVKATQDQIARDAAERKVDTARTLKDKQ